MSPRPDVRAQRIPQIIQAATTIFAQRGFAQTRMEDIAQEAGLSKATLYLYFESKDAVIAALLQQYFAQGFADLAALRNVDAPIRTSLLAWGRRRSAELRSDPVYLSIGYEFFAAAARQDAVRHILQNYYRQFRAEFAALLDNGVTQGEFSASKTAEIADAIIALYEGLTMLWMLEPNAVSLDEVAERALNLLLDGLTHRVDRAQP